MKKIMFDDRYGLTQAVLEGRKTMTRRLIPISDSDEEYLDTAFDWDFREMVIIDRYVRYKIDEEVAIAQKYWDLRNCDKFYERLQESDPTMPLECIKGEKGCHNKMFVKATWMPHRIRITNVHIERLQDVSDDDALREGIYYDNPFPELADPDVYAFDVIGKKRSNRWWSPTPRIAFENLIKHMMGKGTWEKNPYVFVYSFELVK